METKWVYSLTAIAIAIVALLFINHATDPYRGYDWDYYDDYFEKERAEKYEKYCTPEGKRELKRQELRSLIAHEKAKREWEAKNPRYEYPLHPFTVVKPWGFECDED